MKWLLFRRRKNPLVLLFPAVLYPALSLQIPRTRLSTVGSRAFSVFGPSAWNNLPLSLIRTEILYGLVQVQPNAPLFPKLDLPCCLFRLLPRFII